MRKIIFIILSILISTFAMSMEKSSENAQMTIKAKVIKPLTVETIKNMEFGKIVAGTKNISSYGLFEVSGEPGQNVNTKIDGFHKGKNGYDGVVKLKGPKGSKNLDAKIHVFVDGDSLHHIEGRLNVILTGKIDVPKEQVSGEYKNTLTLNVRYE